MKPLLLAWALAALAAGLRADGLDDHWALRGLAGGLREPSATVPVFNPRDGMELGRAPLTQDDWDSVGLLSLRQYGSWDWVERLRLEWNLLATAQSASAGLSATAQALGRSAVLERRLYSDRQRQVDAEIDQLNLRWQGPRLAVTLGRQSVNLGQNFYFSPLDLFQPFNPQDNYRDFRAGVDAARATVSTGAFTQLEALAVAGYAPLAQGGNATQDALWLDGPQGQGSLLARALSGGDAWAVTALGGRFAGAGVGGGSLQCEALGSSWLAEALYSRDLAPLPGASLAQEQATLGWTRQWTEALSLRAEFNAQWGASPGALPRVDFQRHAALAASYQASPLWTLAPALLWYGDVGQAVALLDAGWSASENGSLHITFSLPVLFSESGGPQDPPSVTQSQASALVLDYRLEI